MQPVCLHIPSDKILQTLAAYKEPRLPIPNEQRCRPQSLVVAAAHSLLQRVPLYTATAAWVKLLDLAGKGGYTLATIDFHKGHSCSDPRPIADPAS